MPQASPPPDVRPPWVPSDLFPFPSHFLELGGHRIHYVDEGQGPTLLLFHGNPTWSFVYRRLITLLGAKFRCVAFDLPGFGLSHAAPGYDFLPVSHARVAERFVEKLGLRDISVVVQDWGGPIGLWVAARNAENVRALVLGNTWAWPVDGDAHFERFSKLMGGPVGGFAIRHFNAFVNVMIPLGVQRRKLTRQEMAAYRGPFPTPASRRPTNIFPREIRHSREFLAEVEEGLSRLRDRPTLLLWGDRDIAFREKERQRFEALFPHHHTVVLPGAGHYIQEDASDDMAQALNAWWSAEWNTAVAPPSGANGGAKR